MIVFWQQQALSITAGAYFSVILLSHVKEHQQTESKDTVAKLTDHNSESDTDQSNSTSRHKSPNSTTLSRVGQKTERSQFYS
jgi:hypothetical protein